MYYNEQESSDYYSDYKKSLYNAKTTGSLQRFLKFGAILLPLGMVSLYFLAPSLLTKSSEREVVKVEKRELPISLEVTPQYIAEVVVKERGSAPSNLNPSISQEDIFKITEIILAELEKNETQVKAVPASQVSLVETSFEKELLEAEKQKSELTNMEDVNYYNKVVLSSEDKESHAQVDMIQKSLDVVINDYPKEDGSLYAESLQEEVTVRSNEMKIIVVKEGDTLSKIAKKAYGDALAYPKIFSANPEVIKNPDKIFVGQKLRIPS